MPLIPCPLIPARELRAALQDMEEEVVELTQEIQHLQRFSVDSISFEVGEKTGMLPPKAVLRARSWSTQAAHPFA
jgi:hypothetical protein